MTVHFIDLNQLTVYEAGAFIVSLLAYPGESTRDDERRRGAYTSLCACVLRAQAETDSNWATRPQSIKPVYMSQTERAQNQGLGTLPRRLRDRMIAARMAYPFLRDVETGEVPELPPGVKRLSINAMSQLVLEDAGYSDPENVETRIWRPSRPVIHLASAVHDYLHRIGVEHLGLGGLLMRREVIEHVVRNAEYCEALVRRSNRLHVDADRLVKLRLK